jgi:SHS2 domain-containing protein
VEHPSRFEILDHPADIGFRVRATTLPELFEASSFALISLVLDASLAEPVQEVEMSVEGGDTESVLVNWLNEILYWTDSRRLVFAQVKLLELSHTYASAICRGEIRDQQKHPGRLIVKAVTYHQLRVAETESGWVGDVYVDV